MKLRQRKRKADAAVENAVGSNAESESSPSSPNEKRAKKKRKIESSPIAAKSTIKTVGLLDADATKPELIQEFIDSIDSESMRNDVQELHDLVVKFVPALKPTLDFKDTLGYGKYHYKYKTGREGDWYKIGIACRTNTISFHCCGIVDGTYALEKFANKIAKNKKVRCGKSCVRFTSLNDINRSVLEELIQATGKADIMT